MFDASTIKKFNNKEQKWRILFVLLWAFGKKKLNITPDTHKWNK